jgi:hypothetical protein
MSVATKIINPEELAAVIDRQLATYIRAAQSAIDAYKRAKECRDGLPWWRMIARARFAALQSRAKDMAHEYTAAAGQLDGVRTKLRDGMAAITKTDTEGKDHE